MRSRRSSRSVAPLILTDIYELNVLVFAAINAIMATGLAIVVRTGRLSLAQATFGGVGGYLTGILVTQHAWNYWLALPTAAACAAAFGLILGMASLRLRGFYFAIATLTFGQLAYVVLGAWSSVTGAFSGMFGLPHPSPLGFITFDDPRYYYYVMLAVLCIALIVRLLCTSWTRFGRALSLLGEDDILAQAIGVPSTPYRLSAFVISSAIGGIGGSFNAHFVQGISPPDIAPATAYSALSRAPPDRFSSVMAAKRARRKDARARWARPAPRRDAIRKLTTGRSWNAPTLAVLSVPTSF